MDLTRDDHQAISQHDAMGAAERAATNAAVAAVVQALRDAGRVLPEGSAQQALAGALARFVAHSQPALAAQAGVREAWAPACGGTEQPFRTRSGATVHYLYNRVSGEHAYYDVGADRFLTNEEASIAMGLA